MAGPDYELHLDRGRLDSLWQVDDADEGFPFSEDVEDIEKAIVETLGEPKPRRKRRRKVN